MGREVDLGGGDGDVAVVESPVVGALGIGLQVLEVAGQPEVSLGDCPALERRFAYRLHFLHLPLSLEKARDSY